MTLSYLQRATEAFSKAMHDQFNMDMSVTMVPDFYRTKLLWRRVWPWARRREKLALFTAVLCGVPSDARWAKLMHERLWRASHPVMYSVDAHQRFGEARVRDILPINHAFSAADPYGPNRVAAFADGRVYAYRVE